MNVLFRRNRDSQRVLNQTRKTSDEGKEQTKKRNSYRNRSHRTDSDSSKQEVTSEIINMSF